MSSWGFSIIDSELSHVTATYPQNRQKPGNKLVQRWNWTNSTGLGFLLVCLVLLFFSPQHQQGPKALAPVEQKLVWSVKGCRAQTIRENGFMTLKHNSLALCWQNTVPNKDQLSYDIFRSVAFCHIHMHIVINLKISTHCHISVISIQYIQMCIWATRFYLMPREPLKWLKFCKNFTIFSLS